MVGEEVSPGCSVSDAKCCSKVIEGLEVVSPVDTVKKNAKMSEETKQEISFMVITLIL